MKSITKAAILAAVESAKAGHVKSLASGDKETFVLSGLVSGMKRSGWASVVCKAAGVKIFGDNNMSRAFKEVISTYNQPELIKVCAEILKESGVIPAQDVVNNAKRFKHLEAEIFAAMNGSKTTPAANVAPKSEEVKMSVSNLSVAVAAVKAMFEAAPKGKNSGKPFFDYSAKTGDKRYAEAVVSLKGDVEGTALLELARDTVFYFVAGVAPDDKAYDAAVKKLEQKKPAALSEVIEIITVYPGLFFNSYGRGLAKAEKDKAAASDAANTGSAATPVKGSVLSRLTGKAKSESKPTPAGETLAQRLIREAAEKKSAAKPKHSAAEILVAKREVVSLKEALVGLDDAGLTAEIQNEIDRLTQVYGL